MLRVMILGLVVVMLSGCYYSKGCIVPPEGKAFCPLHAKVKTIQQWQKKDSIGHTDPEQRWKDFQECGVIKYNNGNLDFYNYPGLDQKQNEIYTSRIFGCMRNKNYVYLEVNECQTESQTKLNGKCN